MTLSGGPRGKPRFGRSLTLPAPGLSARPLSGSPNELTGKVRAGIWHNKLALMRLNPGLSPVAPSGQKPFVMLLILVPVRSHDKHQNS
jgi:hypothetical protein